MLGIFIKSYRNDQYGFILHNLVMQHQTDAKVAVSMVQDAKDRFENIIGCSFDKGFHSPANQKELANMLDYVILPKKGQLSAKDKQIEQSEEQSIQAQAFSS